MRPGVFEFLESMSEICELVIFTAAMKDVYNIYNNISMLIVY